MECGQWNHAPSLKALRARCLLVLILTAYLPLVASDNADVESRLRSEYRGRILSLRNPCAGSPLEFNADGILLTRLEPDSWTTGAEIEVTDLHLQNDQVKLRGNRVFLMYSGGEFKSLFPVSSGAFDVERLRMSKDKMKAWEKRRAVTITIRLRPQGIETSVRDAISKVFLRSDEKIADVVPSYWKTFLLGNEASTTHNKLGSVPNQAGTSAAAVGGGVSAPRAIYAPDPEYSELARQAAIQGTVVLWLVVDVTGKLTDIRITHPAGLGLDDKAVQAVSQWKFEPARKGGEAVPVQINVEVSFRLY